LALHDLSWLEHPEWFAPAFSLWYHCLLPRLVRRVARIVTPSEWVRGRILRRFPVAPQKVTVAPAGVDRERFHPQLSPPGRLPARYVLFVGSLQPRKNLGILVEAWKEVARRFPDTWLLLAVVGGRNFRRAALPAEVERVGFLGYVSEAGLPGLYAGALACVLPSLVEGFGLPALEAMACGAPVIVSRAGALPEVVGEAGLFFDPTRPEELAGALRRCLDDPDLRAWLAGLGLARAEAFEWQAAARHVWDVLQSCR
jgi:glycosyltransferase involved in cell wall biosynthesis